jgi:iron complex outermembrane receptor protein
VRRAFAFHCRLVLGLGSLAGFSARAEPVDFNLPSAPADRALLEFSKQAKIEMLFSSNELHGAKSNEVVGRFEPTEAINRLLAGTGFAAQADGPGKFLLTRKTALTGSLKGRLLGPDGTGLRGIRITVAAVRQASVTDEHGGFEFDLMPPGTYELIAAGVGYQPLQIAGASVLADQVLTLEPRALQLANDPTKLDPFLVEGESDRARPFNRRGAPFPPPSAIGNIDLPRTENDVLPYTIYDREALNRSGVANLNEFLQRELLDSDAGTPSAEQDGSLASYVTGSNNLKMRGYGEDETIVLVNGRRLPEVITSFTADDHKHPPPDVNFIPLSLVERVEVLPVSASALYSGNPVGGVINIVLRPHTTATEITTTYTNTLGPYDAPQSTLSLQHGMSLLGDKLQLRLNATFTRTTPPTEAELGYIRAKQAADPNPADPLYRATPNIRSVDDSALFGPGTAARTSVAPGVAGDGGLAAFANRQGVSSLALFDTPGGMATSPDSVDYAYGRKEKGATYFGSATYDVSSWLQLGLDGSYTHTQVNRGYDVFAGDLALSGTSPLNPFQKDVEISLNETAPRLGEDYSEAKLDFYSTVAGLLVKLPAEWRVSLDGQYSRSFTRFRGLDGVDSTQWQSLVDQGLYNPLRDTQAHGPPDAFYDHALVYYGAKNRFVTLGDYQTFDSALRITNQALKLPTGVGALSVGADYRLARLGDYSNVLRYGDGTLDGTPDLLKGRTIQRESVFGEMQGPLVPTRWLPGAIKAVEVDVAARYVVADTTQEANVAPTGGLKIDLAGGFSLRGTIATSNRLLTPYLRGKTPAAAPTADAGGGEVTPTLITDPLRGGEQYGVSTSDAFNPNLHPEASVTRTIGMIFQRGRIHRFRASVDFADTQKSGELVDLSVDQVLAFESVLPGRVIRAPVAESDTYPVGRVTSILTGSFNLAHRHSQNWSTSLDYSWTECFGGRLDLYTRWAYFPRYDEQLLPDSPLVDEINHPDTTDTGLLKHRVNFGASWSKPNFGFGLDGHFFSSRALPLIDQASQGSDHIDPFWQFDASVQSDVARWLPWKNEHFGLRAQVRINNIFDAAPPRYAADPTGAGVQSYGDWRRRVYSLSLTATF